MIKNKKKLGFSMLELVVVMLIMGALTSIAISKMSGSDTGAIKTSMKSDLRNTIRGINACYTETLNFKLCVPNTNPVEFDTPDTERKLGNSIYIGITTEGNSIKITTSDENKDYFGVSCFNKDLGGYISFNNSNEDTISDFNIGGHPTLTP